MVLLTEVKNTEQGLIGITEKGDEVLLSTPTPKSVSRPRDFYSSNGERLTGGPTEAELRKELIDTARKDPDLFYQLRGETDIGKLTISRGYNVYTTRKIGGINEVLRDLNDGRIVSKVPA